MSNYSKLQDVLKELFEMDKADLDFGIYRIMNQKRDQVMDFIDRQLPKDIKSILATAQSKDSMVLQSDLETMGKALDAAGVARETAPNYIALKSKLENSIDTNALEQEVFSHLASFFKRYYKEGDFISMRRYKKDVYAIPYEGEEVKLHWANHDQYYIKTSEYLKNYAFKLRDGKKVYFQLKEASTEQNNNKTQGNAERRFAIYQQQALEVVNNELYINFTYEPHKKNVKQADLAEQALEMIQANIPAAFALAFDKAPTEKNKNRTLIEKHLSDFISRNSFDYFIHKDLGGFLRRELDFYIKNEVLYIDDINTENPAYFTAQLSKIKALKTVATKIIAFLAQIEDFQKKLWLKKKFVISTDYCITLDRVPEKFYAEIVANEAQLKEWEALYDVTLSGAEALKNEPFLVLDTKFFSEEFKDRLIGEFDNLDEETNGLLMNSENFQALNLMQEKYEGKIQGIYIDPPYNTSASEIIYKNSFRDSSWLSLIEGRVRQSPALLTENGIICITIDDFEKDKLKLLLDNVFGKENELGVVTIRNNPSGRSTSQGFSIAHEYGIFYGQPLISKVGRLDRNEKQLARYDEKDNVGVFEWVNFRKHGGTKRESPSMYYPFFVSDSEFRIPKIEWDESNREWLLLEEPKANENIVYPIDDKGIERRWKWGLDRVLSNSDDLTVRKDRFGIYTVYAKARMNSEGILPLTWWDKKEYSATAYGTNLIKEIFNSVDNFSYPKSIYAVADTIKVLNIADNDIVLDYFAGSGTTGHATIKLNREDQGKRKYILVEMGTYFNSVTKPRVQKVIYSDKWKNGKPQDKKGISQLFKYQVLESYEDTLNNLKIKKANEVALLQFTEAAQEEFLLHYMLDVETKDHLFDVQLFRNPFDYQLNVTENNELVPKKVDLVETFNYLIGMYVDGVRRVNDIKLVEGKTRTGEKTLIIWRNLDTTTQEEIIRVFRKLYYGLRSQEFDQIYINGDHHFENFRMGEDRFKVKLIEETFFKQMFNISEL
ncbi:site-specific DNA-methyltransferase [Sphingobacterium sp. GVS05A]|uniref:site-specific DNA-methyltransferase n=1 Tax=Sphingobacterium sp. GVS05A TaxID=2862679 RepID=UPI001CBAD534|nr:site-specific DNA-methyltransferase [Sphingobacterium sp. GVS05A]